MRLWENYDEQALQWSNSRQEGQWREWGNKEGGFARMWWLRMRGSVLSSSVQACVISMTLSAKLFVIGDFLSVVVWIEMISIVSYFEWLVIRAWHYLRGIGGMALLDRFALVGGNTLLGVGFKGSKEQARPSVSLFLLPEDSYVRLTASSLAPCCTAWHHAPYYNNNRLSLWNCTQVPINCFNLKSCHYHNISSWQQNTKQGSVPILLLYQWLSYGPFLNSVLLSG